MRKCLVNVTILMMWVILMISCLCGCNDEGVALRDTECYSTIGDIDAIEVVIYDERFGYSCFDIDDAKVLENISEYLEKDILRVGGDKPRGIDSFMIITSDNTRYRVSLSGIFDNGRLYTYRNSSLRDTVVRYAENRGYLPL